MSRSVKGKQNPSIFKVAIWLVFALLASSAVAVFSHYLNSGFSWFGGVPRLVHLSTAGALMGFFPAVAAIAVVSDRFRDGKDTLLPAVLSASGTWVAQYLILLVTLQTGPSMSDAVYLLLSASCAAILSLFIGTPKRRSAAA